MNTLADRITALPSGVSKFPQIVDRTVTELTAEDLAGITTIGKYAFHSCTLLTSVTIPNSVTNIDEYAFYYCRKLTSITIPNGVTNVGMCAFELCQALKSITIPDSVENIGNYIFRNDISLKSITIGNGVESIGDNAFTYCSALTNFTISSPISKTISFLNSKNLTIDSLKNIINALVDYYGTDDGKYKLTLNSTCNATLEAEGATAPNGLTWREYALFKGWQLA